MYKLTQLVLAILLVLTYSTDGFAEDLTVAITDDCLERNNQYIEFIQSKGCVSLEMYEFSAPLEDFPEVNFYINLRDKPESTFGKNTRCPNAKTAAKKLVSSCTFKQTEHTIKRTANLQSDLKILNSILQRRIESGRTELGEVVVTETEIKLIETKTSNK
ncbi:hypothetical protein NBRC116583_22480 [Arenicella sp. 4NH20-0111]|uniref:hypothetical protein n=1 Tax=Arenicella sp. 4NH20-0111 TaxID=3127648 RepID=UPI00310A54B1